MFVRIHIVQKGDTLWRIAKQYGIGLEELKRLNAHLANPDYIVPGMEIVLPETSTEAGAGTKAKMTKEQQTAPIVPKAVETAPKEIMTKEKMTQPVKEVPKVVETAPIPAPIQPPMPAPVPPQLHFDFAPQMHFQQPQPMPMPMPQPMPQPIFIELPQQPMSQTQVQQVQQVVEKDVEKEIEYVPVPQPHIVYVPFIPHPQPQYHHPSPCGCKEQHFHHQPSPCGCNEQPFFQQPFPCGCFEPQLINYDCGCQGNYAPQQIMPYNMQNFEPNYDVSPVMDTNFQDDEGLPDWLVDSTNISPEKTEDLSKFVMPDNSGDCSKDKDFGNETNIAGVTDYQDMYDFGIHPSHAYYGPYDMQQVMPYNIMPQQQMIYPNCHKPYMNPYSSHYTPWKY